MNNSDNKEIFEISIWAQMFFDDGSVSQGIRFPAQWLEPEFKFKIDEIASLLLKSVNRDQGWMLIWGAGNMIFQEYPSGFNPS